MYALLNQTMREKVPLLFLLVTHFNERHEVVSSFELLTNIQLLQNCKKKQKIVLNEYHESILGEKRELNWLRLDVCVF